MKKYFKCTLKTDIILNVSLATEGNMKTLDYIPGSNFLGVVAKKYKEFEDKGVAYEIFHSGKVSFGNATIAFGNTKSYSMPFSLYQDKLKQGITENTVWVHHFLNDTNRPKNIQLKQHRTGYFNPDNIYLDKLDRKFSLKSAYDSEKRKSKEGAMFGFESLCKGQEFIFSVDFKDDNANYIDDVINELTGAKRIGKSKTAQFGQVEIELLKTEPLTFGNGKAENRKCIVYAESNLCLLNEYGQSTFQPAPKHFGLKGEIDWPASQIRIYSYSPWNTHRNTTSTQRDCILKGSVIVLKINDKYQSENLPQKVGEYIEEGFGRVIYNPEFLLADKKGIWSRCLKAPEKESNSKQNDGKTLKTLLAKFLNDKKQIADTELKTGIAVQSFIDKYANKFSKVSASQWGALRSFCMQVNSFDELFDELFTKKDDEGKDIGLLVRGVSARKYWDKGNIRNILQEEMLDNRNLGLNYIIKLAAEMAKWKQNQ